MEIYACAVHSGQKLRKMDIINDRWLCTEQFKDIESYSKFLMLCKFAGLKVVEFYENASMCYNHYAGVYYPGTFDTWDSCDWIGRFKVALLTIKEAEHLLQEAIKKQLDTDNEGRGLKEGTLDMQ